MPALQIKTGHGAPAARSFLRPLKGHAHALPDRQPDPRSMFDGVTKQLSSFVEIVVETSAISACRGATTQAGTMATTAAISH